MLGVYDLFVVICGNLMFDVVWFVLDKLFMFDLVVFMIIYFILKKYKYDGKVFEIGDDDKRIVVLL